jgi:hypothetical protein
VLQAKRLELREHDSGELKREDAQPKAGRVSREVQKRLGWTEKELKAVPRVILPSWRRALLLEPASL